MPTLWRFNGQGDTLNSRRYLLNNGYYTNVLPLADGDLLITGYADTTLLPTSYDQALFRVRTDSLGNWRGRPRYLPAYYTLGGPAALLALPRGGALWAHTISLTPYVQGSFSARGTAQVVRLDSAQNVVWQRQYPGNTPNTEWSSVAAMTALRDGSYVLVGTKGRAFQPPFGGAPFVVASGWQQRLKANGDTVKLPEYFGNISERYEPLDVQPLPNGGYVIAGNIYPDKYVPVFNCCPEPRGWVAGFDSLGVMQWEKRIDGRNPQNGSARVSAVRVLANGQLVLSGSRTNPTVYRSDNNLAAYTVTGSSATLAWEYYVPYVPTDGPLLGVQSTLAADGSLTWFGGRQLYTPYYGGAGLLTHFTGVGAPYVPDYCRYPPVPVAAFRFSADGDTLFLGQISTAGGRYAQLERWRWNLGDGTSYDGPAPPPHYYAQRPAAGTPVRLTITNNLGCSATQVLYPWGAPTLSQRSQELAASTRLYPNPARERATLRLEGVRPVAGASVQVLDGLGRVVRPAQAVRWSGSQATAELELSGLPAGVYVVRLQLGQLSSTKRLLVQ